MDTPIENSYRTGPENGAPHRFRSEKYPEGTDTLLSRCVFLIKIIDLEAFKISSGKICSKSMILIKKTHRERSVSVPSMNFSLLIRCVAPLLGPVSHENAMGV